MPRQDWSRSASISALEEFRQETVEESKRIAAVRNLLVEADDLGQAAVEESGPASAMQFVALSALIDQQFDDLQTLAAQQERRLAAEADALWKTSWPSWATPSTPWRAASRGAGPTCARASSASRALVHHASDVFTVIGADAVIRYQSPAIEQVLGYPTEGIVGRSFLTSSTRATRTSPGSYPHGPGCSQGCPPSGRSACGPRGRAGAPAFRDDGHRPS